MVGASSSSRYNSQASSTSRKAAADPVVTPQKTQAIEDGGVEVSENAEMSPPTIPAGSGNFTSSSRFPIEDDDNASMTSIAEDCTGTALLTQEQLE